MRQTALEEKIGAIITAATSAIVTSVREEVAAMIRQMGRKSHVSASTANVASSTAATKASPKRNVPNHCVYPDCSNPSKGPRWSFLCDTHKNISKADKRTHLLAWKASQSD